MSAEHVDTICTADEGFAAHDAAAVLAKLDSRVDLAEGGGGDAPSGTFVGLDAGASGVCAVIGASFAEYHAVRSSSSATATESSSGAASGAQTRAAPRSTRASRTPCGRAVAVTVMPPRERVGDPPAVEREGRQQIEQNDGGIDVERVGEQRAPKGRQTHPRSRPRRSPARPRSPRWPRDLPPRTRARRWARPHRARVARRHRATAARSPRPRSRDGVQSPRARARATGCPRISRVRSAGRGRTPPWCSPRDPHQGSTSSRAPR
jgi:hypothetical protein